MNIKQLNNLDLRLLIRNNDNWYFKGTIKFSDHAYNFSSIIINNLISKTTLDNNQHFENIAFNNRINGFTIAHLFNEERIIFSGIISSIGRRSLAPHKLKDCSIVMEDIRSWLSKKSPPDIQFRNIKPIVALNNFVNALNSKVEEKFKIGKVSFTNENNIIAYDTTNKSPYSILKEVIARQTNSFLYFTTDNFGNVLINYKSQNDFLTQEAIYINDQTWKQYKITDINIETNISNYINTIRVESDNVISTNFYHETFNLNNNIKSVWLKEKVGQINFDSNATYIYNSFNPSQKEQLIITTKKEATSGKNYHAYYEKFKKEIVLNEEGWNKKNKSIAISYKRVGKQSVTIENYQQKQTIKTLTGYEGDVYQYTKNNDYSNYDDLVKYGKHEIALNSNLVNEITIEANSPFLNVGDIVYLKNNINQVDGRYICISYTGEINIAVGHFKIKYTLRNSINADTIINFYDNQSYKDRPLFDDEESESSYDKNKAVRQLYAWLEIRNIKHSILILAKHYGLTGKLDALLDYWYEKGIDIKLITENITDQHQLRQIKIRRRKTNKVQIK